jgi:ankyrin repeat protein
MLAGLVKKGSIKQLQKYFSSPGVDINHGLTALHRAASANAAEVAALLLAHGHQDIVELPGSPLTLAILRNGGVSSTR